MKNNTTVTLLTREQEVELLIKAQAGDIEARDTLIEKNMQLVKSVVRKYKDSGLPFEDLVNEGVIGLMKAIQDFDTTSGYKLSTFATHKIRQVAIRALENNGRVVRIPVYKQQAMMRVKRVETELAQKLGRLPKAEEIAKELDITVDEVKDCKKLLAPAKSLDVLVGEDENGGTLMDSLEDDSANFVLSVEQRAVANAIENTINSLKASDRDKEIIKLRFGLNGRGEGMTLSSIGEKYGITRERCRQIEATILKKLQVKQELKALMF